MLHTNKMSSKLIILLTFLAVASATKPFLGVPAPFFMGRITGGSEAAPGSAPYQVSLQWGMSSASLSHFCGGSILNSQWILTAGHCVLAIPSYGSLVVKVGKHNLKLTESTEQAIRVTKSIVHEQYVGDVAPYDIALLKLASPLKMTKTVQAIALPAAGSSPSGTATLTGWGSTSRTQYPIMPDKLQVAKLPLVDLATCKKAVESLVGPSPIHETNVCTGPLSGGYSACSGDSGGPLVLNNKIIGVVSWGIVPCGTTGAPSVYTKTSSFVSWIQDKIAKN